MKEVYIETHRVADTQGNVFAHLGFECFAGQTIITISTVTTCFRMHISPCVVLWSQCTGRAACTDSGSVSEGLCLVTSDCTGVCWHDKHFPALHNICSAPDA